MKNMPFGRAIQKYLKTPKNINNIQTNIRFVVKKLQNTGGVLILLFQKKSSVPIFVTFFY